MATDTDTIEAVFVDSIWRDPDGGDFMIGKARGTDDGKKFAVKGNAAQGTLLCDVEYRFHGAWEVHPKYGRQFAFVAAVQLQPHSRRGVVEYLREHASGVGSAIAGEMWDLFGTDAVTMLRTDPKMVAARVSRLSEEVAEKAAKELTRLADTEAARIDLMALLAGLKVPRSVTEACIERWGEAAAEVVRRDPFKMIVAKIPGMGFARCDRVYQSQGHPPGRLKRQAICVWHLCGMLANGSTWVLEDDVKGQMGQLISGAPVRFLKALRMCLRCRMLVRKEVDGRGWLAVTDAAEAEEMLAVAILERVFDGKL